MALDTNFNLYPYYDDFDENKKFLRFLFKPGQAVQSRELTQLQTLLQSQINRFGNHVFKNGSIVTGGQSFIQKATYLKLNSTYTSGNTVIDIDANNFSGLVIYSNDGSKKAQVIKVYDAVPGSDPITLFVKQFYGNDFVSGEVIKTDEVSPYFATIFSSANSVGTGLTFSVDEGVFYYEGYFIKNNKQTIAISKYSYNDANASARIGFELQESLVTSQTDSTLLDPALNASNYQAPGSDRYKIDLVLASRPLDTTDDKKFIDLARVENGEIISQNKYPLYAVLEDTFARRTYDESGNYTVKPWQLTLVTNSSNSAQTDIILSPGKGYIYGYEFETIAPTKITIDKPRDQANLSGVNIYADYGYYINTWKHRGNLPIDSLASVNLHCVNYSSVSTSDIANTQVGTARVKSIKFDSSKGVFSNANNYIFQTYLFNVNVGSLTGNVTAATANTVNINNYSATTNAYVNCKLRITSGPGSNEPPKKIISSVAGSANGQLVLDSNFITTPNSSSKFSIDYEFNDVKSLFNNAGATVLFAADVDPDQSESYGDTFISEASNEALIFDLGQDYVVQANTNVKEFYLKKVEIKKQFSSNSCTLNADTGESLPSASTDADILDNYYISVTTANGSYYVGDVIPSGNITIGGSESSRTITVTNSANMVANIIYTAKVSAGSLKTPKTKTYVSGNTINFSDTAIDVYGNGAVQIYANVGQTWIVSNFINRDVTKPQSLYVSDVKNIVKILDFNGKTVDYANSLTAIDVTSSYTLDTGQRDSFYDWASIKLNARSAIPVGPLVAIYNRFTCTDGGCYFTGYSYYPGIDYGDIPVYKSPTNNVVYNLRDCLDFRPVRKDAVASAGDTVTFIKSNSIGPLIPKNASNIEFDYWYYLPRIDKVIADKSKSFRVVKGKSSLNPVRPQDIDTGMTLYILDNPAYVANTSNISVQFIENRRYTMRDIGVIDKRVQNLEYYTSLTLLEQDAINKFDLTILDSQNLTRFKNGILADGFRSWSMTDWENADYSAAIDIKNRILRPRLENPPVDVRMHYDALNSTNSTKTGSVITTSYTSKVTVRQPKCSQGINVNPFNVIMYTGLVNLSPQSDVWIDTVRLPDRVIQDTAGDQSVMDLVKTGHVIQWGSWNTYWTGTDRVGNTIVKQQKKGTDTYYTTTTYYMDLGDRIVDITLIPYMRAIKIYYSIAALKPQTTHYPFFDNESIEKYTSVANKFTMANNKLQFKSLPDEYSVQIVNGDTNTVNGIAKVIHTSNNIVYTETLMANSPIANIANCWLVTAPLLYSTMGGPIVTTPKPPEYNILSYKVTSYDHYSGNVVSSTSSSITLQMDASGISTSYTGQTVFITSGPGVGQSANVTGYNSATRVLSISPSTWSVLPQSNSTYSIGRPTPDLSGGLAGYVNIPQGIFKTGEKRFTLLDSAIQDRGASVSKADKTFVARGLSKSVEKEIIATMVAVKHTDALIQYQTLVIPPPPPPQEPLAQTFLVSPQDYPGGIFLSKVKLCFKSKDDQVPITLEIRPAVNGYPSSSTVLPYSQKQLSPDQINIADGTTLSPSLDDASAYTEFVFDSPVFLTPGEFSIVLIANSNKYEVWAAEMGKNDVVTGRTITEQPYGGSLFKSQNASTWTADQNMDLMFEIHRCQFETSATAKFLIQEPTVSDVYDFICLVASDVQLSGTKINYTFTSQYGPSNTFTEYFEIEPGKDYEMDDGLGRRTLTIANSSLMISAYMTTESPDISPAIDADHVAVLLMKNYIGNLELSNSDIIVQNTGFGYTNTNTSVTITGGGGSGATATANIVGSTIDKIFIINPGSGYTSSPNVNIITTDTPSSNAVAVYIGETETRGGNAKAKHIVRSVTLADGFDSGDLRVYMTCYKPSGSQILVYYKMLSSSDTQTINDKSWKLMTQLGNSGFSSVKRNDFRELTFAPGVNGIPDNAVSYTSGSTAYNTFRTFVIKVVLTSEDTTNVPKISDLRVIALPAA